MKRKNSFFYVVFIGVGAAFIAALTFIRQYQTKKSMEKQKSNIDKILNVVLQSEGGYVNDAADAGGETNFGISKRAHPNENIKDLTIERAKEIYIDEYIKPIFSLIANFPLNYQYQVIDTGINCGLSRAKEFHKIALGDVEIFKNLRTAFYKKIAVNGKEKFLSGWLKRVNKVLYN